jgi:FkbM family methyltransferase
LSAELGRKQVPCRAKLSVMSQRITHRQPLTVRQMLLDRLITRELKARIQRQSLDERHPRAVFANEFIGMESFIAGTYERNQLIILEGLATALRAVRQELTVFDVGANIGVHSRFLSPSATRVYAFEPNDEVLPLLEFNTVDLNNVSIHAVALSDRIGTASLSSNRTWNKGTASLGDPAEGKSTEVEVTTLDSWLSPDMRVDLIKLDVEGHELSVLKGAISTLSRCRPVVALEQRSDEFSDANSETPSVRLLRSLGYEMFSPSFNAARADGVLGRVTNLIKLAISRERLWTLHPLPHVPRGLYPLLVAIPSEIVPDLPIR